MDQAKAELNRLTSYLNPHAWALEQDDADGLLEHHRYYFLDRHDQQQQQQQHDDSAFEVEDSSGDTALHRLLALHASPAAVYNFLALAKKEEHSRKRRRHHQEHLIVSDEPSTKEGRSSPTTSMEESESVDSLVDHCQDMQLSPSCSSLCSYDNSSDEAVFNESHDEHVEYNNNLVRQGNAMGVTALHVAVHRNSFKVTQIVDMLLQECPTLASIPMKYSQTYPLHVATGHNVTIQRSLLQRLVQADPSVVYKEDVRGDNPVSLLWKNVLRFRWARNWEEHGIVPDSIKSDLSWMTVIAPDQFRDFCLFMMQAAATARKATATTATSATNPQQPPQQGDEATVTWHDVCRFPRCPPLLIRMLLLEEKAGFPGLLQADASTGCLPLHEAAAASVVTMDFVKLTTTPEQLPTDAHDAQNPADADAASVTVAGSDHTSSSSSSRIKSVLELVLEAAPMAAMVQDDTGRCPLHHAVRTNKAAHDVWKLVEAHPHALRMADPETQLYPAQQLAAAAAAAAAAGCDMDSSDVESSSSLEVVFRLLRECPDIVSYHHN